MVIAKSNLGTGMTSLYEHEGVKEIKKKKHLVN